MEDTEERRATIRAYPTEARGAPLRISERERRRKIQRRWLAARPGLNAAYCARREARRQRAAVGLTPEEQNEIRALYAIAQQRTAETGIKHEVDHDVPLARGGKHHPENLMVVPAELNRRKGARWTNTLAFLMS